MSAPFCQEWICTCCGKAESKNLCQYQYDEFLCEACVEEMLRAHDFLNHMAEMTERK